MPDWGTIPWVGVLVAVVASQIIGFLWYGPLFGKQWLAATGKTKEEMDSAARQAIGVGVVCSIAIAIVVAILLSLSQTPDMASGAKVGLLVSVAMASYIVIAMMYEQGNRTVSMIAVANQVVTMVVMGAIIGAMW